MAQINVNRNTFLEKEEVMNMQSFLQNSLLGKILIAGSYTFGIVTNNPKKFDSDFVTDDNFIDNKVFEVEVGTQGGTIKILPGMAVNALGQVINLTSIYDNLAVPSDSVYYWLKVGYSTKNYEDGLVSVNQKGVVTGTVNFSGKVRGQSGKTPVAIRFIKDDGSQPLNNGVYEIVNIIDNKNLVLTSESDFVAESNLQVIILGTIPLGKVFTDKQLEGLYTYDYYTFSFVQEVTLEQPPTKSSNEFYLARVRNNGGTVSVDNTVKSEFWSLANFPKSKS
nr:MAG TPA: hypothetical protein [Caudoviricetes sp.]